MRKILLSILLAVSCLNWASNIVLSDQSTIQLLTCTPGTETWSKYGHTAVRVLDPTKHLDIVFNYGIFDLMADDFYLKFLRGETYYQLGLDKYPAFDAFYKRIGRHTYWQELNLTLEQKQRIFDALMVNYQPENRKYLYNFVFDNCATRPYHLITNALQDTIVSTYKGYEGKTFREAISHYTGHNSWVDYGINMVFGSKADQSMTNEERLFLPEELMNYIAAATLSDGTPLVKCQQIEPFAPTHVPWYGNCWVGILIFVLLMLWLSIDDRKRGKLTWGIDALLAVVYVLLITIVIFLTCFSCHPLVGFNWRLILFPTIHICTRFVYIFR